MSGQYHPLLKDLENAVRIINGANQVAVTPIGDGTFPLQVVPTYPDLPMEEVFPRKDTPQGQPGAIVRRVGKGRVVYMPGDIDRTFWETLNFDQARLLRNAVLWATDEPAPLTVAGQGCAGCFGLDTEELHDRTFGQPDQPYDDERTNSRDHSNYGAAGQVCKFRLGAG